MQIIFDISPLGESRAGSYKKTGIFRVSENIIRQLLFRTDVTLVFYSGTGNYAACINYLENNKEWLTLGTFIKPGLTSLIKIQDTVDGLILYASKRINDRRGFTFFLKLSRKIFRVFETLLCVILRASGERQLYKAAENADIYMSTLNVIPRCLYNRQVKRFFLVLDLIPVIYPEFFKTDFAGRHFFNKVIHSIDKKTYCVCISNCTKNDLLEFRSDLPGDRAIVSYPGVSDSFYKVTDELLINNIKNKYSIRTGSKYLLCLSTIEPRKNLKTVIISFVKALKLNPDDNLYLVIAGPHGWMNNELYETINNSALLNQRVVFTGFVDENDLAALYSGAMMFIYLSYYEGFGLPVLEAMKCGTPVIASDRSSIPEVAGNASLLADPDDSDTVAQHIVTLLNSPDLRGSLSEKSLKRSEMFTWKIFTDKIINFYINNMDADSGE